MATEFSYSMAVHDFDKSLLPPNARKPGTDEFKRAVNQAIEREYSEFGGWAQIVVSSDTISVRWKADPTRPDPLDVVKRKIERGQLVEAVRLLEHLRRHEPDNVQVLCTLGTALNDLGKTDLAEKHLRRLLELSPKEVTARIALGVALQRQGHLSEAIDELREAVRIDPSHSLAHRSLAGMLVEADDLAEAEKHYRQAIELKPEDQQTLLEFGKCLLRSGKNAEADDVLAKVIELDAKTTFAEAARQERTRLAHKSFRAGMPPGVRPDAVMFCLGAIKRFEKMDLEDIQKITFEIAILGQRGLDTNDPAAVYKLKSLPGRFSGLQLVCMMFVGFKMLTPDQGIGFDLEEEYKVAKRMHREERGD